MGGCWKKFKKKKRKKSEESTTNEVKVSNQEDALNISDEDFSKIPFGDMCAYFPRFPLSSLGHRVRNHKKQDCEVENEKGKI